MVTRFVLLAFVSIGVWFSSINAVKRKHEDNQTFTVNKKFCTNNFSIYLFTISTMGRI